MKICAAAGKRIFVCLLTLLLLSAGTVFAASSVSQKAITSYWLKVWNDGAKVTTTSSGVGANFKAGLEADTGGLKKGYYSVYLYDIGFRNLRAYDGISFHLKNEGGAALKINLTMTVDSKTSVAMNDSSYAILESAAQNIRETVVPSYGTLAVPAGFDGSVYIPFSRLYTAGGKSVPLTSIQSWGITAVMLQNQHIKYQIGNIELLSGSIASMKGSYYLISLSGSDSLTTPGIGSLIEFYHAKVKDLDGNPVGQSATFYLKKSVAGVSISKDGKLGVDSGCTASEVTVCAKLPNSVNSAELTVSLRHGTAAAVLNGIPAVSAVPKITTSALTALKGYLNLFRFFAVMIAVLLAILFYKWFSEANENFARIKNKLYHTDSDKKQNENPS